MELIVLGIGISCGVLLPVFLVVFAIHRKRTHEQQQIYQLHEEVFNEILENFPGFISVLDERLNYRLHSHTLTNNFGIKELNGHAFGLRDPDNPLVKEVRDFSNSEDSRLVKEVQFSERFNKQWHLAVINKMKRSKGYLVMTLNIHSLKQAQIDLMNERDQLMHASRLSEIGALTAGIAHELSNPLTCALMKTYTFQSKMRSGLLSEKELTSYSDSIAKQLELINNIVKSLKNTLRNSHQHPLVPTLLKTVIEDAKAVTQHRLKRSNVQFRFTGDFEVTVSARPSELTQVFINLINNSIDAVGDQENPWVEISILNSDDNNIEIAFTDSGNGIPRRVQENLMTPFFTTKGPGEGTGRGLSICRRILADHGGSFNYDPSYVHTRFKLSLLKKAPSTLASQNFKIAA